MIKLATSNTSFRLAPHNRCIANLLSLLFCSLLLGGLLFCANLSAQDASPGTGRWHESSFIGPEDGFDWHAVFYLTAIEQPQLITRHTGIMIRCTDAPINNNLQVALAFGSVLRTNSANEVRVEIALDGKSTGRQKMVTRNHANAEFLEFGAKPFLQQLLSANTLQFSARLSPKGSAKVALPLAPGRAQVNSMLESCGINLAADLIAEQNKKSKRQVAGNSGSSDKTPGRRAQQSTKTPLARAVSAYLASNNQQELVTASQAIVEQGTSVDALIDALSAKDALAVEARAGLPGPGDEGVSMNEIDGLTLPFHVNVPTPSYIKKTADAGMPMVIALHGGVRRPAWRDRERWWQDYPFDDLLREFLVVSPASWQDAFWWGDTQNRNLRQLISQMQRHYRIDASRVFVLGVSDGGAGALNLAMTHATPLAGVVSLIGHPQALFDETINTGAQPQLANLTQTPIFMVNGGSDSSMPVSTLEPWLESMRALNVRVDSTIEPGMGHELFFSKSTNEKLENFLKTTRRAEQRSEFAWEAGPAQLPSRYEWLVIDKLRSGAKLGCVRAQKIATGEYTLATEGVASVRILAAHGLSKLKVRINPEGRRRSKAQEIELEPTPSVATLLKWHARGSNGPQHYSSEHLITVESNTKRVCQSPRGHTIVAKATQRQDGQRRRQRAAELRASLPDNRGGNAGGLLQEESRRSRSSTGPAGDPTRIRDLRDQRNRSPGPTEGDL